MLEGVLQPAIAYAEKDFFEALKSRRVLTVSVVIGAILVAASASIAVVMTSTPAPDGGQQTGGPSPYEVWYKGPNGVLTAVAFGLTVVVLPFLPILSIGRILEHDRKRGIRDLSQTKPIPPWGVALGKFVGLYGALAVPTVCVSAAVALAISAVAGTTVDGGLFTAYAVGNVLLVGLYLLLVLSVGTVLPSDFLVPVVFFSWIGFNALRRDGFYITGRLATLIGAKEAATYQVASTDLATFTGLYDAFLVPGVPANLGYVTSAGAFAAAAQATPWALLAWFIALYAIFAFALQRMPSR